MEKGARIKSITEVLRQKFIMFCIGSEQKPLHYGFFQNWSIFLIKNYISRGMIYKAKKGKKK